MIRVRKPIPMGKTCHTGSKNINSYQWEKLATQDLKLVTHALNMLFSTYLYDAFLNNIRKSFSSKLNTMSIDRYNTQLTMTFIYWFSYV
jgi:hypothetical protein